MSESSVLFLYEKQTLREVETKSPLTSSNVNEMNKNCTKPQNLNDNNSISSNYENEFLRKKFKRKFPLNILSPASSISSASSFYTTPIISNTTSSIATSSTPTPPPPSTTTTTTLKIASPPLFTYQHSNDQLTTMHQNIENLPRKYTSNTTNLPPHAELLLME